MAFRPRNVIGFVFDPDGTPQVGVSLKFTPTKPFGYTSLHLVLNDPITVSTVTGGSFIAALWCDEDSLIPIDYDLVISTNVARTGKISLAFEDGTDKPIGDLLLASASSADLVGRETILTLIGDKAVRYDVAQSLTPDQKTQARTNIGAETGGDGGSAVWGGIGGTLSNQTDLNTALTAKADLVSGKVPASQLPSYVDDVLEYANLAAFPATGETGKIYTAIDTNKIYRWSGSAYFEISASSGGGVSIGDFIPGATAKSVLFAGLAGILAQNNTKFSWDNTAGAEKLSVIGSGANDDNVLLVKNSNPTTYNPTLARFENAAQGTVGMLRVVGTSGFNFMSDSNSNTRFSFTSPSFEMFKVSVIPSEATVTVAIVAANQTGLQIQAKSGQTAKLVDYRDSSNVNIGGISKNGGIVPTDMPDSSAENNTIYFSRDSGRLVYKDAAGSITNIN